MHRACVKSVQTRVVVGVKPPIVTHSFFRMIMLSGKRLRFYTHSTHSLRKLFTNYFGFLYQLNVINTHFPQGLLK